METLSPLTYQGVEVLAMYEGKKDWLKTEDVARKLQLKKETIAKWCRDGIIKAHKMPSCWIITQEDFDSFVNQNRHGDIAG